MQALQPKTQQNAEPWATGAGGAAHPHQASLALPHWGTRSDLPPFSGGRSSSQHAVTPSFSYISFISVPQLPPHTSFPHRSRAEGGSLGPPGMGSGEEGSPGTFLPAAPASCRVSWPRPSPELLRAPEEEGKEPWRLHRAALVFFWGGTRRHRLLGLVWRCHKHGAAREKEAAKPRGYQPRASSSREKLLTRGENAS